MAPYDFLRTKSLGVMRLFHAISFKYELRHLRSNAGAEMIMAAISRWHMG